MALGKGLASLIPQRGEDAEEMLERIDSMEVVEERSEGSQPAKRRTVSVIEEFGDLEELDDVEMPARPLTTPITIESEPGRGRPLDEQKETTVPQAGKKAAKVHVDKLHVTKLPVIHDESEEFFEDKLPEAPAKAPRPTEAVRPEPLVKKPEVAAKPEKAAADDLEEFMWDKHEEKVEHVPIGDIKINPFQPRRDFDTEEMKELRDSIEQHGILQPLVIRRTRTGFELIAGERRLRAAKELGWDKVPCVVRSNVQGTETPLVYALIENIQRENLNPIEVAKAYEQLNKEYGLTHEEIGERMGTSRVRVTNALRVLQLPAEVQRGLAEGKITDGHAKAILMIPDQEKQLRFYEHLLDEGLTVRKAEVRARRIQRAMKVEDPMRRRKRGKHVLALKYAPKLEERFGFNSTVKFLEEKHRYEVVFRAYNDAEIQQLINRLLGVEGLPEGVDEDIIGDAGGEGNDDEEE